MISSSMVWQSMILFGLLDHWRMAIQPVYFTYIKLILMAKTRVPLSPNRNLSYPTRSSIYVLRVMTPGDIKAVVRVRQLLPDFVTYDCNTITESYTHFGSAIHCRQLQSKLLKVVLQWITLRVTWLLFRVKILIMKMLISQEHTYQHSVTIRSHFDTPIHSCEQGSWSSKH
jgi:hypothetical protein